MPTNTGIRTTITLRLRNLTTDTLTGDTKPNLPGDPDYVSPVYDADSCPVDTSLVCPIVKLAIAAADAINYEFSLPNSVIANPAFAKLEVLLRDDADDSLVDMHEYTDFDPNYFNSTFEAVPPGTYYITLSYKDEANAEIHACTEIATIVLTPTVEWEPINPYCATEPSCDPGYTYDEETETCQQVDSIPATPPSGGGGTPANAGEVNNVQWNNGGAQIFAPGYSAAGNGAIDATLTTPHFWVNGNFQWDAVGRNTTDGRMNWAGIWVAGEVSNPLNEWIGFVRRISTPTARTVYIGMSADNRFRFSLNGTQIMEVASSGLINGTANFNFFNIYPVDLIAGDNFIEMWALNSSSVGGFAMEIYDQDFASLVAATEQADLNVIFSTRDMIGQPFNLGDTVGFSCPPGRVLDIVTDPDNPACIILLQEPATLSNTGYKGWTDRRRLTNGTPDGYEEANENGVGIGTYFPPVVDEDECPLPDGTISFLIRPALSIGATCGAAEVLVYAAEGEILEPTTILYYDPLLTDPIVDFNYFADSNGNIWEINGSGEIVTDTGTDCP